MKMTINLFSRNKVALVSLFAVLLTSCIGDLDKLEKLKNKEDDPLVWNSEFGIPLANLTLNFSDFLEELQEDENFIETDDKGFLSAVYSEHLFTQGVDESFQIPDQSFNTNLVVENLPAIPNIGPLPDIPPIEDENSLTITTPNEESLDQIKFSNGTLGIEVNTSIKAEIKVDIVLNNLKNEKGEPYITTLYFDDGTGTRETSKSDNLSNYTLDLTEGGTTTNTFSLTTIATFSLNQNSELKENDIISIDLNLQDLEIKEIYGDMGNRKVFEIADKVSLNGFDSFSTGQFIWDDPQLILQIDNSFGIPLGLTLQKLEGEIENGQKLNLQGSLINQEQIIRAPRIDQLGETIHTEISINSSNTENFGELLSSFPENLEYGLKASLNPEGAGIGNFVADFSKVDVTLNARLPLKGKVKDLGTENITDFDGEALEDFKRALFRLRTNNSFPLDAALQVYFLNEEELTLDSLIHPNLEGEYNNLLLKAAEINDNGEVINSSDHLLDIELNESQLETLRKTKKLKIKSLVSSPDNGTKSVHLNANASIEVDLGLQIEF
ncbi:hypothetical protein [Xanthovirga aplysinae]|uniref:hypothetical protein n=1 Tax=Xanthovirga aplysinae TaxID=2529853 RepID=UPI001CA46030|nr:hypothetical protein [Xanthovirga aplysinae]MTI32127.1 hypothetical protein [Xanthovirga aplysinae]